MIKNIKSVGVLVAICTVVALLLALTNQITAPIIEKNEQLKAAQALREVMPKGELFEQVNLDDYKGKLPASVTEVHQETNGQGYVIKMSVKGFKPNMIIMCGVTTDGKITGATCVSSEETNGAEKNYGKKFVGKDADGVGAVDTVGGSTMTTTAYKQAMKDALTTVLVLGGAEVDLRTDEEKAVDQLKADLGATTKADLSQYPQLPATVTEAYVGDKGAVIYLTIDAYQPDMKIVCGITPDGKVVNAICLSSNETKAVEKTYGENFVGKDMDGVEAVDTIAQCTYTTEAYKQVVKDAINTALILGGADIDARDPAQILQDNLKAALPEGDTFTKLFITEIIEGVDAVYAADNGKGYVCVAVKEAIGEDFTGEFIGMDADLNIVTAGSTVNTEAAYNAVKALAASTEEDILATFQEKMNGLIAITADRLQNSNYTSIKANVTALKKTATGNYDITINGLGFGYYGDEAHYQPAKNIPIVIRVSITPDGQIIDTLTVSHSESNGYGAAWGDEEYYGQFDGTTAETYQDVDTVGGATISNSGYLKAIERCFTIVTILEGGAE